jgi:hypothetical protein
VEVTLSWRHLNASDINETPAAVEQLSEEAAGDFHSCSYDCERLGDVTVPFLVMLLQLYWCYADLITTINLQTDQGDMDRKISWMERSAKLRSARASRREEVDADANQPAAEEVAEASEEGSGIEQGSGIVEDGPKIQDPEEEEEQAELLRNESLGIRPGAVAVHGPGYPSRGEDPRAGAGTPATVQAYAVNELDESEREERIRRGIIANAAEAVVVSVGDPKSRRYWASGIAMVLAAALAIGIAVPLTKHGGSGGQENSTTVGRDPEVLASLRYFEGQNNAGWASAIVAETRGNSLFDGSATTSGYFAQVSCRLQPCLDNDTNCAVGQHYEPGCCLGPDCPNGTQCGEICPTPPESCFLTDTANKTCTRADCYTCNPVNGQDIYQLYNFVWSIDCLNVGTSVRPENGESYKWAIICGPVVEGAKPELNMDYGQHMCGAMRLGAGYTEEDGGLFASGAPCVYYALATCGCGPPDMTTFGLPEPNGTCQPGKCPFLCEDVGIQYARNLCFAFPGNISWWEGQFGGTPNQDYEYELYIKGVDD